MSDVGGGHPRPGDALRPSGLRWPAISRPDRSSEEHGPSRRGVPPPHGEGPTGGRSGPPLLGRPWVRLAATVVLLPAIVVVALVVARPGPTRALPAGPSAAVPAAAPPLVAGAAPTGADTATGAAVQVAAGMAGSAPWSLWAGVGSGRLRFRLVASGTTLSWSADPRALASLVARTYGPAAGFPDLLVYGVTSVPAARIAVHARGARELDVAAYPRPVPGGLRFYAATFPAPAGTPVTVEALSDRGTPLVRASSPG